MRDGSGTVKRKDWLERAVGAALAVAAAAAVVAAVRLGAAAATGGESLLADMRARAERRLTEERQQIGPALAAAARGEREVALREAEAALARFEGNAQLHLLLAGVYREGGDAPRALREYRRAVELVRDCTDRRSPQYIGAALAPWLREIRPALSGAALGDLRYLERALAGGCS